MKELLPIEFDPTRCREELEQFRALLAAKDDLSERADLLPFFRRVPQLAAFLGANIPYIGPADRLAYEFEIVGDFAADLVIGNSRTQTYCAIELEDARAGSVFQTKAGKATTEWGARFEHGFSQLVDWFYTFDDQAGSASFAKHFGYGHVRFFGMLLIGRRGHLRDPDKDRLRWRQGKVAINSHHVICHTYDDMLDELSTHWHILSHQSHQAPAT